MPIDAFPDDIETLRALVVAAFTERDAAIAERDHALSQIDRLRYTAENPSTAQILRRHRRCCFSEQFINRETRRIC